MNVRLIIEDFQDRLEIDELRAIEDLEELIYFFELINNRDNLDKMNLEEIKKSAKKISEILDEDQLLEILHKIKKCADILKDS